MKILWCPLVQYLTSIGSYWKKAIYTYVSTSFPIKLVSLGFSLTYYCLPKLSLPVYHYWLSFIIIPSMFIELNNNLEINFIFCCGCFYMFVCLFCWLGYLVNSVLELDEIIQLLQSYCIYDDIERSICFRLQKSYLSLHG